MNLLLDTHIFLWAAMQPAKLSDPIRQALEDPANALFLSAASVWEMQIKAQIGKLQLSLPVEEFVPIQRGFNNILSLPIFERHIWALDSLPLHHKDPFDRLLMAQAVTEEYQLVTVDPIFARYEAPLLIQNDNG
jgi:PIN domain nuclease of toxin-antitoxin system